MTSGDLGSDSFAFADIKEGIASDLQQKRFFQRIDHFECSIVTVLESGGYFVDLLRVTADSNPGLGRIKEWSEVLLADPAQVLLCHRWNLLDDGPVVVWLTPRK